METMAKGVQYLEKPSSSLIGGAASLMRNFNKPTIMGRLGRYGGMAAAGLALGGLVAPSIVDGLRGKGFLRNKQQ
jgi:hypothetical protein